METATTITISSVTDAISTVYSTLLTFFGNIVSTITGNALLYVPILLFFVFVLVKSAIRIARKLGLKGVRG